MQKPIANARIGIRLATQVETKNRKVPNVGNEGIVSLHDHREINANSSGSRE